MWTTVSKLGANATSVYFGKVIDRGFFVRIAEVRVEKSRLLLLWAVFCWPPFFTYSKKTHFFCRFRLNSHGTVLKKSTQCDI